MTILKALKHALDSTLRWTCVTLFAILVLLVVWQVFIRQVLHSGNAWTEVVARIVFIWQALFGAAYVIGEKDDVAIDFLVRKFPAAVTKAVAMAAHAVVAFFAGWIMVYGGQKIVASTWDDRVQLLPVSQGVLYLALPVAGALIVIYSLIHIVETAVTPLPQPVDPDQIDISQLAEEGI